MQNSNIKMQNAKLTRLKIVNRQSSIVNSCVGLTLIEVLIAMTILTIGLLGVAMMQVTAISGNSFSKEMAVATSLGQDMFEKLLAMQYDDLALTAGNHPTQTDMSNGLAVGVNTDNIMDALGLTTGPRIYTRTWTVADDDPVADMKKIEIKVEWRTRQGSSEIQMTRIKVE